MILLVLLIAGNASCQSLPNNTEEDQKIKTIYQLVDLIKNKDYEAIKLKYGNDYFLKSENDFRIKVDHAEELFKKYGVPDKKNITFKNQEAANPYSTISNVSMVLVNKADASDNIQNARIDFVFLEGLGSEKIVNFSIHINDLPNTVLPPLNK